MTLDQMYKSRRWQRKKRRILRRDKYLCQNCMRYGRHRERTDVHHIIHADERPDLWFDNDNLVSLCRGCHNKMHPEKGGKKVY